MKELILIRHAKSDWGDASLDDHERSLNDRGLRDAPRVGEELARRGAKPDVILTSTAVRAQTTARAVAGKLDFPAGRIAAMGELYLADVSRLLRIIQDIDEFVGCALILGHNPGFHDLANRLLRDGGIDEFVTCAVVRLDLDVAFWGEVEAGCGRLREHFWPRQLRREP